MRRLLVGRGCGMADSPTNGSEPEPTWESMTPLQRLTAYRRRFDTKISPVENRRHANLDSIDLALLAELPVTPPDEKDRQLNELRERLHRPRTS